MGLLDLIFGKKDSTLDLLNYFQNHELYSQLTEEGIKKIQNYINEGEFNKKQHIDKAIRLLVKTNNYIKDKYGKTYF